MKKLFLIASFAAMTAFLPAVPVIFSRSEELPPQEMPVYEDIIDEEKFTVSDEPYRVLSCSTGMINEVSVRDYVIGAVAAEMPASFEPEALKAQAVAAHTYAERQRIMQKKFPDKGLGNADFSDDSNKYQGFFTNELIRKYFGENYEKNYKKIADAADEVLDCVIVYEDEPIIAAFHSMSSGKTESAENVWGTAVDYLIPADSKADTQAPGNITESRVPLDFFRLRLEKVIEGAEFNDGGGEMLEITERSSSGTVLRVNAGGIEVSGGVIRDAFGLRSADFTVSFTDEEAVFTVRGFGHGVGMSQYGANDMAKKGKTWQEIIAHYYPGTTILLIKI